MKKKWKINWNKKMNSEETIDYTKIAQHLIDTSDNDYKTMINLFESKDNHWALFLGHLVIEKLIKADIARNTKKHPPFLHDLRRLAKLSHIVFNDEQLNWLNTITTFNLNARYDSYKQEFYKKCTPSFTKEWINKIKGLRLWIKKTL